MKIISKYKDYYDCLVGVYGMDEIMIFDRRFNYHYREFESESDVLKSLTFHICGKQYLVHLYKGQFYHVAEDLMTLDKLLVDDGQRALSIRGMWWNESRLKDLEYYQEMFNRSNGIPTDLNLKFRTPILIKIPQFSRSYDGDFKIENKHSGDRYYTQVLLKDYGFPKWYPADFIWNEIYSFVSNLKDHPPIPDNQTNEGKILSHGFDVKKSFRHRK